MTGGVTLALKDGSSNGVGVVDVKYVLAAFQEINKCRLIVQITIEGSPSRPNLILQVEAWDNLDVPVEPVRLASQRCPVGSLGPRTMEAAILQALYALDAQMAEEEFVKAHRQSVAPGAQA